MSGVTSRCTFVVRCHGLTCGPGYSERRFAEYGPAREHAIDMIEELGFERVFLIRRDEESLPLPEPAPRVPTFVCRNRMREAGDKR